MSQVLFTAAGSGTSDPVAWSGGPGLFCVGGTLDGASVLLLVETGGVWVELARTDEAKAVGFNAPAGSTLRAAIMLPGSNTSVTVTVE
jgi:predicted aspartyl protease